MDPLERLAALFDAHEPRLRRLARRHGRDVEEARDLVQETFLRAARRPGSVPDGGEREEAWLVRVLVNVARDQARRRQVRDRGRPVTTPGPAAAADPESAALARIAVRDTLGRLPPWRRAVAILRYLEDEPPARIALLLGVTQVTVRWHLMAARRTLAAELLGRKETEP